MQQHGPLSPSELMTISDDEKQSLLMQSGLFPDVNAVIGLTSIRQLRANEILYAKHDSPDAVYIVCRGQLRLAAENSDTILLLKPGMVAGEIALANVEKNNEIMHYSAAQATAIGAVVIRLTLENFRPLLQKDKSKFTLLAVLNLLNQRLRSSNERLLVRSGVNPTRGDETFSGTFLWSKLSTISNFAHLAGIANSPLANMRLDDFLSTIKEYSEVSKGTFFFNHGALAKHAYIILDGEVEVLVEKSDNQHVEIARLGVGQMFGFISLLEKGRTSTAIRASSDVVVVVRFDRKMAQQLWETHDYFLKSVILKRQKHLEAMYKKDQLEEADKVTSGQPLPGLPLSQKKVRPFFKQKSSKFLKLIKVSEGWCQDTLRAEYPIANISLDQVLRSWVTTECVIPNIITVNERTVYDAHNAEPWCGPQSRISSLTSFINAICLEGLQPNISIDEVGTQVGNLLAKENKGEREMQKFVESGAVPALRILRLCSFSCWAHCDKLMRERMPQLFKAPFKVSKEQGLQYHVKVINGVEYGATIHAVLSIQHHKLGTPLARLPLCWTINTDDSGFSFTATMYNPAAEDIFSKETDDNEKARIIACFMKK